MILRSYDQITNRTLPESICTSISNLCLTFTTAAVPIDFVPVITQFYGFPFSIRARSHNPVAVFRVCPTVPACLNFACDASFGVVVVALLRILHDIVSTLSANRRFGFTIGAIEVWSYHTVYASCLVPIVTLLSDSPQSVSTD